MATPSTRNLVLLLTSGHTVRIALREDDLTDPHTTAVKDLLRIMPAVASIPYDTDSRNNIVKSEVIFAYVEDPSLPTYDARIDALTPVNDFQRITVEGPGTVVQYG